MTPVAKTYLTFSNLSLQVVLLDRNHLPNFSSSGFFWDSKKPPTQALLAARSAGTKVAKAPSAPAPAPKVKDVEAEMPVGCRRWVEVEDLEVFLLGGWFYVHLIHLIYLKTWRKNFSPTAIALVSSAILWTVRVIYRVETTN